MECLIARGRIGPDMNAPFRLSLRTPLPSKANDADYFRMDSHRNAIMEFRVTILGRLDILVELSAAIENRRGNITPIRLRRKLGRFS